MGFVTIHYHFQVKIATNVMSGVNVVSGTRVHNIVIYYTMMCNAMILKHHNYLNRSVVIR